MVKKEYPATHSMSTAWFGIDKEGNVALIDMNENGPVPESIPHESCIEDLLFNELPTIVEGISEIPLTDDQSEELSKLLEPFNNDFESQETLVQIDISQREYFESVFHPIERKDYTEIRMVRLSKDWGLYLIDLWGLSLGRATEMKYRKTILKSHPLYLELDDSFDESTQKYVYCQNLDNFPFFLYQQPYSIDALTERTYEPKFPLKEIQLSEKVRLKGLKFNERFKDLKYIQLAQRYPSNWGYWYMFEIDGELYSPLKCEDGDLYFVPYASHGVKILIDEAFANHDVKLVDQYHKEYEINGVRGYFPNQDGSYSRFGIPETKIGPDQIQSVHQIK